MWDLAYAATAFGHLFPDTEISEAAARLTAFGHGYGADRALREALPAAMTKRAHAMHDLLRRSNKIGHEPWGTMYVEGHGEYWAGTASSSRITKSTGTLLSGPHRQRPNLPH